METNKRLEVREVKETKKEEPEYTPLHSSSHKNNTPKDYHVLQEKVQSCKQIQESDDRYRCGNCNVVQQLDLYWQYSNEAVVFSRNGVSNEFFVWSSWWNINGGIIDG